MYTRFAAPAVFSFLLIAAGPPRLAADDSLLAPVFQIQSTPISIDAGWITNAPSGIAFSEVVQVPGAAWLRLNLDGSVLGANEFASGAYLRLTSLADNAVQTLNAIQLEQWGRNSAYFNGDAVQIELNMPPGSGPCRVVATQASFAPAPVEPADDIFPHTYCGTLDNRQLSDDGRVARIILASGAVGTVFMIDDPNHTFLTSGNVAAAINDDAVIEFHAPLTYPDGVTLNHPPPEDQYVADLSSIQRISGAAGSGNNWGYFGALPNSTTSLTPFQAEGAFFSLADLIPPPDGRMVRTYGNGTTQPPIFRTWSFVQKTEVAEYVGPLGTSVRFRADLTSGDSGAAILDETTGQAIAIATDDGCTASGGFNAGTAVTNQNLRDAINHPLGVCVALVYAYPNGIPELLNPNGGSVIRVVVSGANGAQPQPGSGLLHYSTGFSWTSVPMTQVAPNEYDAVFPAFPCGTFVDYYFSATTTTGIRVPDQIDNPINTFRSAAATSVNVLFDLDFQEATGWTVDNISLTDGAWELGVPAGNGTLGDPTVDFDGSGQCWLTGNTQGSDVDGGPTRLRSPTYNLSATSNAFVSYARWFTNVPQDADRLSVQVSNNGGLSYSTFEMIEHTTGWQVSRHKISDLLPVTASMRFRFAVSDNPNTSRTEAALDAFSIIDYVCDAAPCTKADVDNNAVIDGRDVRAFTSQLLAPGAPGSQPFCAADMDSDGVLEVTDDLPAFVNCLLTGSCP
jgi:hypothetical protein